MARHRKVIGPLAVKVRRKMSNLKKANIKDILKQDKGSADRFVVCLKVELEKADHPFGNGFTNCVIIALCQASPMFNIMWKTGTWSLTNGTANAIAATYDKY